MTNPAPGFPEPYALLGKVSSVAEKSLQKTHPRLFPRQKLISCSNSKRGSPLLPSHQNAAPVQQLCQDGEAYGAVGRDKMEPSAAVRRFCSGFVLSPCSQVLQGKPVRNKFLYNHSDGACSRESDLHGAARRPQPRPPRCPNARQLPRLVRKKENPLPW